jgi:hypothetical protein
MKRESARQIIASLDADEIRKRIKEIEDERKALLTLLRAAIHIERANGKRGKTA